MEEGWFIMAKSRFIYVRPKRSRHVTNSAYGFTLGKMVCLGFVQHPDTIRGDPQYVEHKWLTDKTAKWKVNIAGRMVGDSWQLTS